MAWFRLRGPACLRPEHRARRRPGTL